MYHSVNKKTLSLVNKPYYLNKGLNLVSNFTLHGLSNMYEVVIEIYVVKEAGWL